MTNLHITNGDGAAGVLKVSEVSGDVLPWRDPMHHGPFPGGLSLTELRPIRAKYLAGSEQDVSEIERDFQLRDDHLTAAVQYDRIVLWFEHDVLDQLQILQILDWCGQTDLDLSKLELICINTFPGFQNFRGIGELDPVQMASLCDVRTPVTRGMLDLARDGWQAFRASDPRNLREFCDRDLTGLPFLRMALLRHLQEYPWTNSGLTRTETQLLQLVESGVNAPHHLFVQNMDLETALFLGDWGTYSIILKLCRAGLLRCADGAFWYFAATAEDRRAFQKQRLELTDKGQLALSGALPVLTVMDRDQWLGGVHLNAQGGFWAWDDTSNTIVRIDQ